MEYARAFQNVSKDMLYAQVVLSNLNDSADKTVDRVFEDTHKPHLAIVGQNVSPHGHKNKTGHFIKGSPICCPSKNQSQVKQTYVKIVVKVTGKCYVKVGSGSVTRAKSQLHKVSSINVLPLSNRFKSFQRSCLHLKTILLKMVPLKVYLAIHLTMMPKVLIAIK